MDRVIDLQFGKEENACHILVELYAQGNVILTDSEYTILSLLRSYTLDEKSAGQEEGGPARCAVKEKYPFSAAANLTEDNILTDPIEVKKIIESQFQAAPAPSEPKEEVAAQ